MKAKLGSSRWGGGGRSSHASRSAARPRRHGRAHSVDVGRVDERHGTYARTRDTARPHANDAIYADEKHDTRYT